MTANQEKILVSMLAITGFSAFYINEFASAVYAVIGCVIMGLTQVGTLINKGGLRAVVFPTKELIQPLNKQEFLAFKIGISMFVFPVFALCTKLAWYVHAL